MALTFLPTALIRRNRLSRSFKHILTIFSALWTLGLCAATLQFTQILEQSDSWIFQATVALLGLIIATPFAILTYRLFIAVPHSSSMPSIDTKTKPTP